MEETVTDITGTAGNDSLTGVGGNNLIEGLAGQDTLTSFGGKDTLIGGADNDTLIAAENFDQTTIVIDDISNDTIRDFGFDTIYDFSGVGFDSAADVIGAATHFRNDLIITLPSGAQLTLDRNASPAVNFNFLINANIFIEDANPGVDLTLGNTGVDLNLTGGAADDTLNGDIFGNGLNGGGGNDSIRGLIGDDTLNGDAGNDTLVGGPNNDMLFGGTGGDFLIGDAGRDMLDGGAGAAVMTGGLSINDPSHIDGTVDDTFVINGLSSRTVITDFEVGIDALDLSAFGIADFTMAGEQIASGYRIELNVNQSVLLLGAEVDLFNDPIDETINGSPFDDVLDGLAGDDLLTGGNGDDSLFGGAGNDTLRGEGGEDTLQGGDDDDVIEGGDGDDLIIYEDGDGDDDIDGGDELDTLMITGSLTGGDVVTLTDEDGYVRSNLDPFSLEFSNIEFFDIDLQGGNDDFSATTEMNLAVEGGAGNDTLRGGKGDDFVDGGEGDDLLLWERGDGTDALFGGPDTGNNRGIFTGNNNAERITLSVSLLIGVTVQDAQGPDEEFSFSTDSAEFRGEGGNDFIDVGGVQNSGIAYTVDGGQGNDTLIGSDGDDVLIGGAGSDDITGDSGFDTLTGGAGDDLFIFDDGFGQDEITDFNFSEDFIELNLTGAPEASFTQVGPDTIVSFAGINDQIIFRGANFGALPILGGDGAPIAQDDAFTVSEGGSITGNVLVDNGAGADADPNGDALTITQVNGDTASVGEQFAVEGGGVATVNADGSLSFDTSGAFADLSAGEVETVSFTYLVSDGVLIDRGQVTVTVEGVDTAAPLEGTNGPDEITGTSDADVIIGGGGRDTLNGGGGADQISGNGGRDQISGGGGRDTLDGGGGRDIINGNGGRDDISGGGGRDELFGGGGRDLVKGGGGRDTLDGGGGRDTVEGGGGSDVIAGGRGRDELTGGGGRDIFEFTRGSGPDTLTDYRDGVDRFSIDVGADSFADLTITQAGDNALVRFANVRIIVEDTDIGLLGENDFIFA